MAELCDSPACNCSHHRVMYCLKRFINDEARNLIGQMENAHEMKDSQGRTLLHLAVEFNNEQMVDFLVAEGWNVDAINDDKKTPMMVAVEMRHVNCLQTFISYDADLYGSTCDHMSILEIVANSMNQCSVDDPKEVRGKRRWIMQSLFRRVLFDFMKHKYAIRQVLYGATKMLKMCTLSFAAPDLANCVLHDGFDMNYREPEHGFTPLNLAVFYGCTFNASMLIRRGVDVNIGDNYGDIPLRHYARYMMTLDEKYAVLHGLLSHSDDSIYIPDRFGKKVVEILLREGDKDVVRAVWDCGVDMVECLEKGRSLVYVLAYNKDHTIYDVLDEFQIEYDINAVDDQTGNTALMIAVHLGHVNKVEYLAKHGADVNALRPTGHSVLGIVFGCDPYLKPAFFTFSDLREKLVTVLLHYGADVQMVRKEGTFLIQEIPCCRQEAASRAVVAHLALMDACDIMLVLPDVRKALVERQPFHAYYDLCRGQLQLMRLTFAFGMTTMLDLLLFEDSKLPLCALFQDVDEIIYEASKKIPHLQPYYASTLKRRVDRAKDIYNSLRTATNVIKRMSDIDSPIFDRAVFSVLKHLGPHDLVNLKALENCCFELD